MRKGTRVTKEKQPSRGGPAPAKDEKSQSKGKKASKKAVPQPKSEDSSGESEFEESEDERDDETGGGNVNEVDGLSSVIFKIVNQKVKKDVPVLEKRKITNVEKAAQESEDIVEAALKKRKKAKVEEVVDEATLHERILTSLTKERNLKKIATKGVVALFNAIMESKKSKEEEDEEAGGGDSKGLDRITAAEKKKVINDKVKNLTKSKFLNLLTTGKGSGADGDTNKQQAAAAAAASSKDKEYSAGAGKGWDVLKEDAGYSASSSSELLLRDWDKDDDED
jgi:hypothetical protein